MDNVSRPLIALLVATVALFGLYFVAFRGGSATTSDGTSQQSLKDYSSDIAAAHNAVATSNHASVAQGNVPGTSTGSSTTASTASSPAAKSTTATKSTSSTTKSTTASKAHTATKSQTASKTASKPVSAATASQKQMNAVDRALAEKKVLALLFYNPAGSDDRAVKQELGSVPTHKGRVVKLAVPINQLASYEGITTQVPINETPTLVLITGQGQASEIVGFASGFEIAQRVADALAAK